VLPDDPKQLLKLYGPTLDRILPTACQLEIVRFSPCGTVLAAAGMSGEVFRWDFTGPVPKPLESLKGHRGWVTAMAWHPKTRELYTGDSWGRLTAWPAPGGEPRPKWTFDAAHDGWIRQIAVSGDGTRILTCGRDTKARIADAANGTAIRTITTGDDVFSVAWSPDDKEILTGELSGWIKIRDAETEKSSGDFDARAMYLLDRIQDVGGVRCLLFDLTGKSLYASGIAPKTGGFVTGTNVIVHFDWKPRKLVKTTRSASENDGFVHRIAWHPAGFLIGAASGQPGQGKLFFQRTQDDAPFYTRPETANCHSFDLHPDGRTLVVSGTSSNSSGNGRPMTKDMNYPTNTSPLHILKLPGKV